MLSDLKVFKSAAARPPTGCAAPLTIRPARHRDDSQTVRALVSWLYIHSAWLIQL